MSESIKLNLEVIPLKEMVPLESPSEMDFLIRITAPERQIEKARPQLNLGLVLDRSGSMSGSKIEKAREAACYCVDQLAATDRISITVFDDKIQVIVPATPVEDRRKIKGAIRRITSGGTTALHAAWVEGAKQVAECAGPALLNRVLLITDGLANVGITEPEAIVTQASGLYQRGISTSTIGIGNDFNEDLLVAMAKGAGGNSWFIEGPEDFQRIFETEMEGLLREVCSKVNLGIEAANGVEVVDLLNDFDSSADGSFSLPGLLAGEPLDVVIRLKLPGGVPGRFHCFRLKLEWSEEGTGKRLSSESAASIAFASAEDAAAQSVNREVQKAVQFLEGARVKCRAMEYLDRGDYQAASFSIAGQLDALRAIPAASDDSSVSEEIAQLSMLHQDIDDRKDLAKARKSMAYQSTNVQRGRREKNRTPDGHKPQGQ